MNSVVDYVKEWLILDDSIKSLRKKTREFNKRKKELTDVLIKEMRDKEINMFETNNGNLVHTEKKIKCSISKKHLVECFEAIIQNDEDRNKMLAYILENRKEKVVENIERKK